MYAHTHAHAHARAHTALCCTYIYTRPHKPCRTDPDSDRKFVGGMSRNIIKMANLNTGRNQQERETKVQLDVNAFVFNTKYRYLDPKMMVKAPSLPWC